MWLSSLRRQRGLVLSASTTASPLIAAVASCVWEYHAGLWALKSPKISVSSGVSKSREKLGEYWGGQEE